MHSINLTITYKNHKTISMGIYEKPTTKIPNNQIMAMYKNILTQVKRRDIEKHLIIQIYSKNVLKTTRINRNALPKFLISKENSINE